MMNEEPQIGWGRKSRMEDGGWTGLVRVHIRAYHEGYDKYRHSEQL